ncbi:MAG: HEAT repeat domain-containing protein [Planctomycetes bacterium]|nr:HEAT repeat domain-containing protein [Planctomycetota bacterium]MCB9868362.1 HEAT repeat domain-containing protein [Planctomycetota bacterium]
MEENLELYFCEICNESVPLQDLSAGRAKEIKGKTIGACCLPVATPQQAKSGNAVGLTTLGALLLAGLAAATMFLESRLGDEIDGLRRELGAVRTSVSSQGDLWSDLEKRVDKTLQSGALAPLEQRMQALGQAVDKAQESLAGKIRGSELRFAGLDEVQKRLIEGQGEIRREIKGVETEVVRTRADLASLAAAPRARPAEPSESEKPVPSSVPAAADAGLPAALAHHVTRLKDADAGNRFEAVDQLVQSKNPKALEHLLPMLKDPDPFVRRLTAEGLSGFRDRTTVDALLIALADPEGIVRHTAHGSLKKLTGQTIAFDPDASASARSTAQRRWKDWWAKARDKF